MLSIICRVKWNLLQQQSCYCRKTWYIVPVHIIKRHLLHFVYRSASLQERPWNIHISVSDIIKMHLKILKMHSTCMKLRIGSSSMSILAAMYFIVENICWHFIQKTMANTYIPSIWKHTDSRNVALCVGCSKSHLIYICNRYWCHCTVLLCFSVGSVTFWRGFFNAEVHVHWSSWIMLVIFKCM